MADHIEIAKEDISKFKYKFQPYPSAPKPPPRNRTEHGGLLKKGLSKAVDDITHARKNAGVEVDKLLVFDLTSDAAYMKPNVDVLQRSFKISIVEEVQTTEGTSHLVVQFENKDGIIIFERERALYEQDNQFSGGLLTYAQRRDLFACISGIRTLTPEDRTGKRLMEAIKNETLPDGLFIVDIDVWYNGDKKKKHDLENNIKQALGTSGSTLLGDLFELPNILLGRVKLNQFTLNALRNLDLIAMIDFPIGVLSNEQCELYSSDFVPILEDTLDKNAPLACVIDSGVFSGNILLSSSVVGEEDFDLTESTPSDLNGHGTAVAGIVAYGNFYNYDKPNKKFKPLVRICNGKVMHNHPMDDGHDGQKYADNKRPEQIIEEAIKYFHKEYQCRVFNLSSGDIDHLYRGGRQWPWASMLDNLSRELDIVIVVSSGNVQNPVIPKFSSREELQSKARDQLLTPEHHLIDPATTALGITVGAITKYSEPENFPNRPTMLSVGSADYPSVFTRTGEGVGGAIKPDFVDYGGNYAILQSGGRTRWSFNRTLNEPTLNNTIDKVFKGYSGTSFSAPHVTHIAARLERALQEQLGDAPSANLIRAMLASSAKYVQHDWLKAVMEPGFSKIKKQTQSWVMRLSGYGKVDDTTLFTDRNHVTLFAEDDLDLRSLHLYKIPVPKEFLDLQTHKRIAIGFAYNPPTLISRKAYIANSLWFEVFRRIDADILLNYKAKKVDEEASKQINKDFSQEYGASFSPGYTEVKNSTLQQRIWEKAARGGSDLLWENNDPYIYILVTGKENFSHPHIYEAQPYALAITFSYDSEEDIQLRQRLSDKVTIKQRERARTRTQV